VRGGLASCSEPASKAEIEKCISEGGFNTGAALAPSMEGTPQRALAYSARSIRMRYTFFEVSNYRGIGKVRLELDGRPHTSVVTLVGLNESGKTTILEAMSAFPRGIDLSSLEVPGYSQRDPHDLIPIGQRSNFHGSVSVKAGLELDEGDKSRLIDHARRTLGVTLEAAPSGFVVEQRWTFRDSLVVNPRPTVYWTIKLLKRAERKGRPPTEIKAPTEEWNKLVAFLRESIPHILYFPNFLFELPDRIFLEPVAGPEEAKHAVYRAVMQDVLDALKEGLSLNDHVLTRAKSGTIPDSRSLENVLLKMGDHVTNSVFARWNRIFKRSSSGKEIRFQVEKDEQGRWFVQLRLKDGSSLYEIGERSLGFRWFFAFLLLTQYRGFRQSGPRGVLFLLDEPASNLHPSAQEQLLESFGRFPQEATVVYTTHSHHMVNPQWLEGTYVVKEALHSRPAHGGSRGPHVNCGDQA
jgi:predicted ATPase